jgi:hypothetical protein
LTEQIKNTTSVVEQKVADPVATRNRGPLLC